MSYYNQYSPITPIEYKITLLLVMEGYKKDDIHFRNELGSKNRYLRCAYWEYIKTETLKYVEEHANVSFNMEVIEDSDCLDKYCYKYKIKGDV
tara:strand:- start:601 stop:879 length:279 start_codon:yes stop_codon:yes gene_type:complete